jgi:uncharacterized protein (DUF362 family)
MGQVFDEAERELEGLLTRYAHRPRAALVQLLLLALEREEIVSMAYRQAQIAARLRHMPLPDDVRGLIEHAVIWVWKDEEMHAVYARGALMRLGSVWLRLRALAQQAGGCLAGWATAVLHHGGWRRAPLARLLAHLVTLAGRLAGKVPRALGRQLRYVSFRDFCLLNADLERASWMAWDRLALLAEQQRLLPEMIGDFHRVAADELRHLRVFEAIAAHLTPDDRLAPGADATALAERVAAVGPHFLPHGLRGLAAEDQPVGSGGTVWSLTGAAGEDPHTAFRRVLVEADLAGRLARRARALGKTAADLRVIVKTCFMLGYHRKDPSPLTDPALVRDLVAFLKEQRCGPIAVAESRNLYDDFFHHRTVREVATYFGLEANGFRLVDLSEEQEPHAYGRGMSQATVARSWRDADYRITFGKVRSHPVEVALLSLANLEGVGGRSDQFLFAERQADRSTAVAMILDEFPPHFALLDCWANVPDGLVGMMGCVRPKQPRRFYAGADGLAVDVVAGRHLGMGRPDHSPLLAAAAHWFGGWPEGVEVGGDDRPLRDWRGPYDNGWYALLSLLALPVYVWGSGRGSLFVPEMDEAAFPPVGPPGAACRGVRTLVRWLLGLRRFPRG